MAMNPIEGSGQNETEELPKNPADPTPRGTVAIEFKRFEDAERIRVLLEAHWERCVKHKGNQD